VLDHVKEVVRTSDVMDLSTRNGLDAEHVLAGLHALERPARVLTVWYPDVDSVYIGVGEELGVVAVRARRVELAGLLGGALLRP
jgi:hypothetical protein